jgi:hypothetical protein
LSGQRVHGFLPTSGASRLAISPAHWQRKKPRAMNTPSDFHQWFAFRSNVGTQREQQQTQQSQFKNT